MVAVEASYEIETSRSAGSVRCVEETGLVYATCSVLRDENDRQIAAFLARTDDAEDRTERPADAAPVAAGWQLLTRDNGPDGFYLACLHKRKSADDNKVTDQRS